MKIQYVFLVMVLGLFVERLLCMEQGSLRKEEVPGKLSIGIPVESIDISGDVLLQFFDTFVQQQITGCIELIKDGTSVPEDLRITVQRLVTVAKIGAAVAQLAEQDMLLCIRRYVTVCSEYLPIETIKTCFSTPSIHTIIIRTLSEAIQKSIHGKIALRSAMLRAKEGALVEIRRALLHEQEPFVRSHENFLGMVSRVREIIETSKAKGVGLSKEMEKNQQQRLATLSLQETNFALMQKIIELSIDKTIKTIESDVIIIVENVVNLLYGCM